MYVFVYGTLKQGFPNHHHMPQACQFVDEAVTVRPFPLVVAEQCHGLPFLLNLPGQGLNIEGEVFQCNSDQANDVLNFLDEFEGVSTDFYRRISIDVRLIGKQETIACWTYVCGESARASATQLALDCQPQVAYNFVDTAKFVAREDR
eukprot:TRINITY_DN6323_c0_g1_i1.p1 TRINITY_DN6323_c0_g1~~TRINITY_DN6323_c0_g1_i1.p1  ORF type:complete len:159 (+),score=30.36 TRINITY_DN6323_c0_g1_i1:35-478(+)